MVPAVMEILVHVLMDGMLVHQIVHIVSSTTHHYISMKFNMVFNIIQSIGQCPLGPAWADKAYATDQAHQNVECSNAGTCDRKGGTCSCFPGFTGAACQRSKNI